MEWPLRPELACGGTGPLEPEPLVSREPRDVLLATFPGTSAVVVRLRDEIAEAARSLDDLPVLILGEPGTGKTRVAQALHAISRRRAGRLEQVNCAGISPSLFESEAFGHEKGAFTGAAAERRGWFELAHGGTLFLDEIGDLPLDQQAKLLVVLQERRVRRVGARDHLAIDIAVVAATNRDLPGRVRSGEFRDDLYDRLNGVTIRVPALRERIADLDAIARGLLAGISRRTRSRPLELTPEARALLARLEWPGNLRQLDYVLRRVAARCRHDLLTADLVPLDIVERCASPGAGSQPAPAPDLTREQIAEALACHGGNIRRTAATLGITRARMYRLMQKLGISRP